MQYVPLTRRVCKRMPKICFLFAFLLMISVMVPRAALCVTSVEPTLLKVRLQSHLTSYVSRPGSPFHAVVISDYERDGRVLIPRGSLIYGTVRRVTAVGLGFLHERARLTLNFREYQTPDGQHFPLSARLVSIDNAREKVLPDGQIRGVLAAQNPNGLLNGFWYNPASDFDFFLYHSAIGLTGVAHQLLQIFPVGAPGAAALLALRCVVIRFPEPEIHLAPGTDMNLAVMLSSGSVPSFPIPPPTPVPQLLAEQLDALPREITRHNGRPADDIINVVFTGSRQQLMDAFAAVGWSSAEHVSVHSLSHEYLAFSSMRSYETAPVSRLYYRGMLPDLVFQKSLSTVTKRDHIRIWHYGLIDGQDVWLGAATHDSGITFRASGFAFSHKIDGALDLERSIVVDDLSFAGCAAPVSFMEDAAEVPTNRGGFVTTDGRLAVLSVKGCDRPLPSDDDGPGPGSPGNKLTRVTRRLVLESRNYFVRENAYYWAYELIRFHRISGQ